METSRFRLYSIGVAAENKELTMTDSSGKTKPNDMLMVTPLEQMTMLDGEIKSNPLSPEASGTDATGASYTSKVTVDNAVKAKWLPQKTNRRTAPDVRRGERVLLWQYGDTDTFFWTELGWDDHLRKLETVTMTFSGTADESKDSTDPTNCYGIEVSTHEGLISIWTSKANNEKCAYVVQINTKNGTLVIADDVGNNLQIDSVNTLIQFTNANGTTIAMDKKNIKMVAPDSISMTATNSISLQCKDYLCNASNSVVIKTNTFTMNNQTSTFNTPETTFNGDVAVNGNFTMTSDGTGTFNGNVKFTGAVEMTQPIKLAGGTSSATLSGPHGSI